MGRFCFFFLGCLLLEVSKTVAISVVPSDDWRQTINDAPSGSIIDFGPGQYRADCSVPVVISKEISLVGESNAFRTQIDCASSGTHFHVVGGNLTLLGITLRNGQATNEIGGGCLSVEERSYVRITDVLLEGCSSSGVGGAIAIANGVLDVKNTRFVGNSASEGGGCISCVDSNLSLQNSTFYQCSAGERGGAVDLVRSNLTGSEIEVAECSSGGQGGGIAAQDRSHIFLSRGVAMFLNQASGNGGGMHLEDGSNVELHGEVSVIGNLARGNGGGIAASQRCAVLLSDTVVVQSNVAWGDGGGAYIESDSTLRAETNTLWQDNEAWYYGGGIALVGESTAEVRNGAHIDSNTAWERGGAVYVATGSVFEAKGGVTLNSNYAAARGGAVFAREQSRMVLEDGAEISWNEAGQHGGAIYVNDQTNLTLRRGVELRGNTAWSGFGGAVLVIDRCHLDFADGVALRDNYAGGNGGALFVQDNNAVHLRQGVQLVENQCSMSAGAIYLLRACSLHLHSQVEIISNYAVADGGAIFADTSSVFARADVKFVGNTGEWGGAVFLGWDSAGVWTDGFVGVDNKARAYGGMAYVGGSSSLIASGNITLANNSATYTGGALVVHDASRLLLTDNVRVRSNTAWNGGGVALVTDSSLKASSDVELVDGVANAGGAILAEGSSAVTLSDRVLVQGNQAYTSGGGVHLLKSTLRGSRDVRVLQNAAGDFGGGFLASEGASVELEDDIDVVGNSAGLRGGGVYLAFESRLSAMRQVRVNENSAESGAGLNAKELSSIVLTDDATVSWNRAAESGAGILLLDGCTLRAAHRVRVAGNRALAGHGGGMYLDTNCSAMLLDTVELAENTAGGHGGGVYIRAGSSLDVSQNVSVTDNFGGDIGGGIAAFSDCQVHLERGVLVQGNQAGSLGGGVCVMFQTALVAARGVDIQNNSAELFGGGIFSSESSVRLSDAVGVDSNLARTGSGGGMYLEAESSLSASTGVSISSNQGALDGGGVAVEGLSSALLSGDIMLANNSAGASGGGLFVSYDSVLVATGIRVLGNEATDGGGIGAELRGMVVLHDRVVLAENAAGEYGGAVYLEHLAVLQAEQTSISRNSAGQSGGGVLAYVSDVDLSAHTTCEYNVALLDGGCVDLEAQSTFRASHGVMFARNVAGRRGAGVAAARDNRLDLQSGVGFLQNVAGVSGGAVFMQENSTLAAARNVSFLNCWALGWGGGGGLSADSGSSMMLTDGIRIAFNGAMDSGGGVLCTNDCSLVAARDVKILWNEARVSGGGIATRGSRLELREGVRLTENTATFTGGAVDMGKAAVTVIARDVVLEGNEAPIGAGISSGDQCDCEGQPSLSMSHGVVLQRNGLESAMFGGGLAARSQTRVTAMRNVSLVGNRAHGSGGAIYATSGSSLELSQQIVVANNTAFRGGGAYVEHGSALSAAGVVEWERNDAGVSGGGIYCEGSSITFADRVLLVSNSATEGGGGIYSLDCLLTASQRIAFTANHALFAGGAVLASSSSVRLNGATLADNVAHSWGSAVFARSSVLHLRATEVARHAGQHGAVEAAKSSHVELVGCNLHDNKAIDGSGGCVSLTTGSSLFVNTTSMARCHAVGIPRIDGSDPGSGGAVAVLQGSRAEFGQEVLIEECSAYRSGGGIYAEGSELAFTGETLVRHCMAANGGGIGFDGPVEVDAHVRVLGCHAEKGSTVHFIGDYVGFGGGLFGTGGTGRVVIGVGHRLEVAECWSSSSGGGIALMEQAALLISTPTCPASCRGYVVGLAPDHNGKCDLECLQPSCNWDGGGCSGRWEAAGEDAARACDRSACGLEQEHHTCTNLFPTDESPACVFPQTTCAVGCVNASCDWSEGNPSCWGAGGQLAHVQQCPRFDAVALASIEQQGGVVYVDGGTSGGFGRCATACEERACSGNASACGGNVQSKAPVCQLIDDGGKALLFAEDRGFREYEYATIGGEVVVAGPAWGECQLHRPRLPTAGFDYDPASLRSVASMPIDALFNQFPECGLLPLVLRSNHASQSGGGLFQAECDAKMIRQQVCFVGGLRKVSDTSSSNMNTWQSSLLVSIQNNSAGVAGGGVYTACPVFGDACQHLMDTAIGLPSLNQATESMLSIRNNSAKWYGPDTASAPFTLDVVGSGKAIVPGQDPVVAAVTLQDWFGQPVSGPQADRSGDSSFVVKASFTEFVVCSNRPAGIGSACSCDDHFLLNATDDYTQSPCWDDCRCSVRQIWRPDVIFEVDPKDVVTYTAQKGLMLSAAYDLTSTEGAKDTYVKGAGQYLSKVRVEFKLQGDAYDPTKTDIFTYQNMYKLSAPITVPVAACRKGQVKAIVQLKNRDFGWTCQACKPDEYVIDSLDHLKGCVKCPVGAKCDGAGLVGLVAGSEWEADMASGEYRLQRCPRGTERVTTDSAGEFSQLAQECRPCKRDQYILDPSSHACQQCPTGGLCNGDSLATRNGLDSTGEVAWEPRGERLYLTRCPTGYRLEASTYEGQECQPCGPNAFILSSRDPAAQCQPCPPLMTCPGGRPPHAVSASLTLSLDAAEALPALEPLRRAIEDSAAAAIDPSAHAAATLSCSTCGAEGWGRRGGGGHMVSGSVVVHSAWLSAEAVAARLGAEDMAASIQAGVQAAGLGGSSVELAVDEADAEDGRRSVGMFEVREGRLHLVRCPAGYLLFNHSLDTQQCYLCPPMSYAVDPLSGCTFEDLDSTPSCPVRECFVCPTGATCSGGDDLQPRDPGSTWELERSGLGVGGAVRLMTCPPGSVLVRNESRPAGDECIACPPGSYAVREASWSSQTMTTALPQAAAALCLACPDGAQCRQGGAEVTPLEGFWVSPADRTLRAGTGRGAETTGADHAEDARWAVDVYRCPLNACLAGGKCAAGRDMHSVVCSACVSGRALSGNECRSCGKLSEAPFLYTTFGIITVLALSLLYFLTWKPFFASDAPAPEPEDSEAAREAGSERRWPCWGRCLHCLRGPERKLRSILHTYLTVPFTDYAKVAIAFMQVLSTFERTYTFLFPDPLVRLWKWLSVLSLNFQDIPGFNCLVASYSYLSVLVWAFWTPLVLACLLGFPKLILDVSGQRGTARWKHVNDMFWYSFLLLLFLVYIPLSTLTLQGFSCRRIEGRNLFKVDMTLDCPTDDRGPIFVWSTVATILFPFGIPCFTLVVMWYFGIPELARKKVEGAVLEALLHKFKALAGKRPAEQSLNAFLGNQSVLARDAVLQKADALYASAVDPSSETVTAARLAECLQSNGIEAQPSDLEALMECFVRDASNGFGRPEFADMVEGLLLDTKVLSSGAAIHDLDDAQLRRVCMFSWDALLEDDVGEAAGFKRELLKIVQQPSPENSKPALAPGAPSQLSPGASHEQSISYLLGIGRKLQRRGLIALPVLKWDGSTEDERVVLSRLGFALDTYQVQYWFMEIAEMGRKLLMTSLVVYMSDGSPEQLAAGCFIAVLALALTLQLQPMADPSLGAMQALSLGTIAATLFYALVAEFRRLRGSETRAEIDETAIVVVIIVLHVFVFTLPVLPLADSLFKAVKRAISARCCARADSEAGDQADTAEPGHAPAAAASEQHPLHRTSLLQLPDSQAQGQGSCDAHMLSPPEAQLEAGQAAAEEGAGQRLADSSASDLVFPGRTFPALQQHQPQAHQGLDPTESPRAQAGLIPWPICQSSCRSSRSGHQELRHQRGPPPDPTQQPLAHRIASLLAPSQVQPEGIEPPSSGRGSTIFYHVSTGQRQIAAYYAMSGQDIA